ncbi:MAG TPA: SDR family oxidoreductase [Chroococcidiopsis sp.]
MPRHAIITGGSSGIGYATAQRLVREGVNVSIIARSQSRLDAARDSLARSQPQPNQPTGQPIAQRILALSADVSDRLQAEQAIQTAIAQLGAPDWLITCAGICHPGHFQDLPIEIFEQTMAINYFGSLYCVRAALPAMQQQRQGKIALVSSGAGLIGLYGYTPYSPSKFALRGLGEALRGELKPWGIGVSVVYPPDTDTPQLIAENQTKPEATKRITATAKLWSADGVAREIIGGMAKNRFAIAPGSEMGVLSKFHSLLSPALNWYFDRIVAETAGSAVTRTTLAASESRAHTPQ